MSFTYKGITSTSMGLNITERSVYNAPSFDLSAVEVPGRSGTVLVSQNRYKNKVITYTGFVRGSGFPGSTLQEKLSKALQAIKGWLCSDAGVYNELTDDNDPGFTRLVYLEGETAIQEIHNRPFGVTVKVTFNAQPFMYGPPASDTTLNSSGGTITNPNAFAALPKLELTMSGAGTLTIENNSATVGAWSIASYSGTLKVDSEAMDWYDSTQLRNSLVTGNGFPALLPGVSTIKWTGGISKVKITPRWRTL